eukprot:1153000-Pelagomonas_calceolata.AAC.1
MHNGVATKAKQVCPKEVHPHFWPLQAAKTAVAFAAAAPAAKKAAAAAAAAPVKLKGTLARMDPAQLIQHLNIDIDVQPLQEFSIAPPVRE